MPRKKTKKAPKKGKARASTARKGAKRMKLVAHVGFDFDNYMKARSFSFTKRKGKKLPEIRKVDTKKGRSYVVVLPVNVKMVEKIV